VVVIDNSGSAGLERLDADCACSWMSKLQVIENDRIEGSGGSESGLLSFEMRFCYSPTILRGRSALSLYCCGHGIRPTWACARPQVRLLGGRYLVPPEC